VLQLTARVVACRQQDATSCFSDADQMACGRSAHDAILADEQLLNPICGSDLCDQLCDLWVVVAAITADDEVGAFSTLGN